MLLTAAVGALLAVLLLLELVALVAIGALAWSFGADLAGYPGAAGLTLAAVAVAGTAWFLFAAERPYFDHPPARLLVKVLVFGTAAYALWLTVSPAWSIAFLVTTVVVNAVAGMRILPAES